MGTEEINMQYHGIGVKGAKSISAALMVCSFGLWLNMLILFPYVFDFCRQVMPYIWFIAEGT